MTVFSELVDAELLSAEQGGAAGQRIRAIDSIEEFAPARLIVEAITESVDAKQSVYERLEAAVAPTAIIASSTSGLPPAQLCTRMLQPERFLVAHFWNPPHILPLVEVVPHDGTSENVIQSTMRLLRDAGCDPVILRKAIPGFIGNRIQFAVLREALHLLQLGVADASTIDSVIKESLGRRYRWIGPLEGADLGGLDTFLKIGSQLMPELAKDEEVLDVLRSHVEKGETGRTTGRGIFLWDLKREQHLKRVRQSMLNER